MAPVLGQGVDVHQDSPIRHLQESGCFPVPADHAAGAFGELRFLQFVQEGSRHQDGVAGTAFVDRKDQVVVPWTRRTGGPSPSST